MAKALTSWKVFPHPPLEQLAPNLWRVEQPLSGMPLRRVMTAARMDDGKLVLHNAIALDEASMKTLEAAGPPSFLLVPNGFHRLDAKIFKDRYPALKVVAPRGSKAKVEEVVPVDMTYEQFPGDSAVRLETLDGVGEQEGAMIVSSPGDTTLVLNDVVFNMPHQPGAQGFVIKLMGSTGGPKITRVARFFLVKEKKTLQAHLERLASLPDLKRIIVSHHEVISQSPGATLRSVAATL